MIGGPSVRRSVGERHAFCAALRAATAELVTYRRTSAPSNSVTGSLQAAAAAERRGLISLPPLLPLIWPASPAVAP